nr:MAG TPA: hypothetical protein [Caudoviricetes sp.]
MCNHILWLFCISLAGSFHHGRYYHHSSSCSLPWSRLILQLYHLKASSLQVNKCTSLLLLQSYMNQQ